jgi:phenylacetate-CoA ligase
MARIRRNPVGKLYRWAQEQSDRDIRYRIAMKKRAVEGQWLPEEKWRRRQLAELRKLLRHAYRTTVYYRELFDRLGLRVQDIRSLSDYTSSVPVLEKEILRQRVDDLISGKWRDRCRLHMTTGSTGNPTPYAKPYPDTVHVALESLVNDFCSLSGKERSLHLSGRELPEGGSHAYYARRNLHRYSFFHIAPQVLEEVHDLVLSWRPEFIYGYSSLLDLVADGLEAKGHAGLGVKVVQSHSEPLYPHRRAKLQRVFGAQIHDHYGCGEMHHLGVECPAHTGIHLFAHLRMFEVEPLDEHEPNRGELIVTDLCNPAMPLLRYRVGDVVRIDRRPCPCGRSLPRITVEGRAFDMVRLRNGEAIGAVFFDDLMLPEHVQRFLVYQRDFDHIDVHIVPTPGFTNEYGAWILDQIRGRAGEVQTRLCLETAIDDVIAGKRRSVRSDVSSEAARSATADAGAPVGAAHQAAERRE